MKKLLKELKSQSKEMQDFEVLKSFFKDTNQFDFMLEKQIEIPYMGTFEMSPLKIGLIACVNEYYFGNKDLAKSIIEDSFSVIIENKKNSNNPLDEKRIIKFLKKCKNKNLLDENYNFTDQTIEKFGSEDMGGIAQSIGLLFEIYLNKKIKENNYKTNFENHIKSSLKSINIKYIVSILDIIYLKNKSLDEIENIFNENLNEDKIKDVLNIIQQEDSENFVEKIIDPNILNGIEGLDFKFDTIHNDKPLDIEVRYNNMLIALIDVKSSQIKEDEKGKAEYNSTKRVSTSTNAVAEYVSNLVSNENNKKDFNFGLIRITYKFKKDNLIVKKLDNIYMKYNESFKERLGSRPGIFSLTKNKSYSSNKGDFIVKNNDDKLNKDNVIDFDNSMPKELQDEKIIEYANEYYKDSEIKDKLDELGNEVSKRTISRVINRNSDKIKDKVKVARVLKLNPHNFIYENPESRKFYYEVLMKKVDDYKNENKENNDLTKNKIFDYFKNFLKSNEYSNYVNKEQIEDKYTKRTAQTAQPPLSNFLFGNKGKFNDFVQNESFCKLASSKLLKEVYSDLFIKRKSLRNVYSNIYKK